MIFLRRDNCIWRTFFDGANIGRFEGLGLIEVPLLHSVIYLNQRRRIQVQVFVSFLVFWNDLFRYHGKLAPQHLVDPPFPCYKLVTSANIVGQLINTRLLHIIRARTWTRFIWRTQIDALYSPKWLHFRLWEGKAALVEDEGCELFTSVIRLPEQSLSLKLLHRHRWHG